MDFAESSIDACDLYAVEDRHDGKCRRGQASNGRGERSRWLLREVTPHESDLRRFLGHRGHAHDSDDIVQQCYLSMLAIESVTHIKNPRHYLFAVARSVIHSIGRRLQIVDIGYHGDMTAFNIADETVATERSVDARLSLARIDAAIAAMPERRRAIVHLRQHEQVSGSAVAERFGVGETTIRNELSRALADMRRACEPDWNDEVLAELA
ncbi:RNA polymerase sigma-70 factor, ECF subfamily [Sphingopyxis sp. YR583]|uniref:RNA polymerase sigma factor n=1 Tax=Sphingopyxis sp. YR583 TaxID=1881047 RepID=UPI0008A747DC|nr:sigma-70 family RNA polymerase sigma factor [Sphingopyxis sp. YR583]SEH12638.1 RNA polymerase sigma-70 factor, ECF subfamily [Sphingopyxis sp. YR583]